MSDTRSVVWVDANGYTTITRIRTSAGAASIRADLLAASQADWLQDWEGALNTNGAPAPAGGSYRAGNTRCLFTFGCSDGSQVDIILPAPSLSIFLSDQQTVDITNGLVVTLVADCVGSLESSTGSPATALLAARLVPIPYRG